MKKTKVGAILHNKEGNLLLQLRDEEPEKGNGFYLEEKQKKEKAINKPAFAKLKKN